jgi:hypothetical protein
VTRLARHRSAERPAFAMRTTVSAVGSLLLFAGLAVAVSGCEVMPDREFAALESALALNVAAARRGAAGSADFSFELTNRGKASAKACLGPSRTVSYRSAASSGTSMTLVDHPGCTREFAIQSGGVMSWDEALEVPRLQQGHVLVEISVQIVNPRRCGSWGNCAAFDLKSNQFEIPIAAAEPQARAPDAVIRALEGVNPDWYYDMHGNVHEDLQALMIAGPEATEAITRSIERLERTTEAQLAGVRASIESRDVELLDIACVA